MPRTHGPESGRFSPVAPYVITMTDIEIEYCVPCGHLNRAIDLQRSILETYGQQVDGVRLKTGDGGVFVVRTDGSEVFDIAEDEYDVDAIVDEVGAVAGVA